MVAASVRTIFAQPDQEAARPQLGQVARTPAKTLPRVAELLLKAEEDVLAYVACGNQVIEPRWVHAPRHAHASLLDTSSRSSWRCTVRGHIESP